MKRLHLFKDHPHVSIHERAQEPQESKDEKPHLSAHRQETPSSTEYIVSLDNDPTWLVRIDKKSGKVHAYMGERSLDFDGLDQLYDEWPELPVHFDGDVNAAFRAMFMDDEIEPPATPAWKPQQVSESESRPNDYHEVPEEGGLKRQIAVCDPDCKEYFIKVGESQFIFRLNPETNWCRLNVRQVAREFQLSDLYEAVPELPIIYKAEVNNQLRDKLHADGFVVPETPYALGYSVSNKDED